MTSARERNERYSERHGGSDVDEYDKQSTQAVDENKGTIKRLPWRAGESDERSCDRWRGPNARLSVKTHVKCRVDDKNSREMQG
jgi:hypothetical protein